MLIAPKPRAADSRPPAVAPIRRDDTLAPDTGTPLLSPDHIDDTFHGLVLGVNSMLERRPNGFESRVLRELDRLLAADVSHSDLVPRLPSVIPRIMTTLRDEDSSAAQLATELGRDAVLVSEVIRISNSAFYRVSSEIASLERAVVTLGRTGIRQLVANAAFRPLLNLNTGHFTKVAGTLLWDHSEKAAILCDCMAKYEKIDRFHAYLMAIVQNVGLTVALQILDRLFDGSEAPHTHAFRDQLIRKSRRLTILIARQWDFPPEVVNALESQSDNAAIAQLPLPGAILCAGDRLAKLHMLADRGRIGADTPSVIDLPHPRLSRHYESCYRLLSIDTE
jgi:HD-like signal output (HDOD) protein